MRWSIVICTHNRASDLKANLCYLNDLEYPLNDYEILVVDNDSEDETAEVIKEAAAQHCRIVGLQETKRGLSFARNRGIEAAQGELVIFLDDDARPEPNWLTEMERGFEDPQVACVGGRVVPLFASRVGWPAWLPERLQGLFSVVEHPTERDLHYPGYPAGTNIAFRKSILSQVGVFSGGLGRTGQSLLSMEETEICLRIERAGFRIHYLPDAVVHHAVNETRLTHEWVMDRCHWQGISAAVLEKEQFSRGRLILKSILYLPFVLAAPLAATLYRCIGNQRASFFCRCQAALCRAYLKKAWIKD